MSRSGGAGELPWSSVVELSRAVRSGELSVVHLVDAYLDRIAAVNADLNAVVQIAPDVRERAAAAQAAVERGSPLGPLHGIPFTAKDNIATAGVITAIGVPERADHVPSVDATVVARMRAAGAILLGKTNCPPWGGGIETDNEVYGRTNNPHDPARTCGGSSGGEAAIVAAGGSPCGIGTDSGGSVRLPAHFCGATAIKPTATLVPVTGVEDDEGQIGAFGDPRTQAGLFATCVADLALLLPVVAGPDGKDGGVPPVPLGELESVQVAGLRVGFYLHTGRVSPTPETAEAVRRAAGHLASAGAPVGEVELPGDGHALTREVWRSYRGEISSLDLYRVFRRWDAYRAEMLGFMADLDVIICPVYPVPAPPHGGTDDPALNDALAYTTPFSLTGQPCVVLPYGRSPEGLPIGLQIVAGPWQDHVALAVAGWLERAGE